MSESVKSVTVGGLEYRWHVSANVIKVAPGWGTHSKHKSRAEAESAWNDLCSKSMTVTSVAKTTSPEDALMAQKLTAQFRLAVGGLWEVVKFGAMMINWRDTLSARGQGNINNLQKHGEGLSAWITSNCPDISRPTAYRFMAIAEGMRGEVNLGVKVDLLYLLTADHKDLEPKLLKKRADIQDLLEGRSQRQLLLMFAEPKVGGKGGANQLNQWLKENYPDMVGTPASELPKEVRKEFIEWKHSQRPSAEQELEQEREVLTERWLRWMQSFRVEFIDMQTWQKMAPENRRDLLSILEEGTQLIKKNLR